jgi:hypothetical protein
MQPFLTREAIMTALHLFKRPPEGTAADPGSPALAAYSRWDEPEPIQPRVGFLLLGLGTVLGLAYLLELFFAERDDAGLLLIYAAALLFAGSAWLLVALGQKIASRFRGVKKRCGCCHFFEVPGGLYVIGRCQVNPSRRMVTRTDGCSSFCFSERAMVRDRLGQHPGVIKQPQIIRTSDISNQ